MTWSLGIVTPALALAVRSAVAGLVGLYEAPRLEELLLEEQRGLDVGQNLGRDERGKGVR